MKKYKVYWATKIGGGCTYYSGVEIVEVEEGEDEEDRASEIAVFNVWRRAFTDFSKSHIRLSR